MPLTARNNTSNRLQAALEALRGRDPLLDRLLDSGKPVTREMYLAANYCGEEPVPLPAELEAHLPEPLRIWSPFQTQPSGSRTSAVTDAWEKARLDLNKRLSAFGPTVKVMEPSDTPVFKATLPQGRRPAPKSRAK